MRRQQRTRATKKQRSGRRRIARIIATDGLFGLWREVQIAHAWPQRWALAADRDWPDAPT